MDNFNYHTVNVVFEFNLRPEKGYAHNANKRYAYLTDDITIKEGDMVIVETQDTGLTCVRVVDVHHYQKAPSATKWVIQKVDMTAHEARQEKIKKAAEITSRLDKALAEKRKMLDYEKIAEGSPEIKALLEELKNLGV